MEEMAMEIERTVVINLDRDDLRLNRFYQALPADWPFSRPVRFPAVDGSRVPAPPWWIAGDAAWGCFRSHQGAIEQALNDRVHSLLVMEDDAVCQPEFLKLFGKFVKELPADWQWVYLGGQHIQRERGLPTRISEHVYRPFNAHRSHAYAFRGADVQSREARPNPCTIANKACSLVRLFPSESNDSSKVRNACRGNASAVGTRH